MSAVSTEGAGRVRKHALNDPYVKWVLDAGGLPILFPNVVPSQAAAYLSTVDGLILTGGDDVDPSLYGQERRPECEETDPVRDAFEVALVRAARKRAIPTLAICRGLQVANVALGGTLVQDIPAQVRSPLRHRKEDADPEPPLHEVSIVEGTRLHAIAGGASTLRVNSFHHQAPDRVADGLRVTARTSDGVVEAMEDPALPFFLGVQWHPERATGDPFTKALFAAFLEACGRSDRPASSPPRSPAPQRR
jgi:putative glutamine amidotransferase